MSKVNSFV